MKIKLLAYAPKEDLICGTAALASTKSENPSVIFEKTRPEAARRIIKRVTGYGHVSIVEHVSFTFSIEEVSRAMTH